MHVFIQSCANVYMMWANVYMMMWTSRTFNISWVMGTGSTAERTNGIKMQVSSESVPVCKRTVDNKNL